MKKAIHSVTSVGLDVDATTKRLRRRRTERLPAEGLRDSQKRERFDRIKRVARDLFLEKGYDRTTLRMIGKRAKLGAGTILRYVEDKRALLYLLFNEDHQKVTAEAIDAARGKKGFLDANIERFRLYYRYFGAHPEFARAILREATFRKLPSNGPVSQASGRSIQRIQSLVEAARQRGEIATDARDEATAFLIFEIYQIEARRWLSGDDLDVEIGLRDLRKVLSLLMQGLTPRS
jgi:AcrR family transcriptional regulator